MLAIYVSAVMRPRRLAPLLLKRASGAMGKMNTVDIHMPELYVETHVVEKEKISAFPGDRT